MAAFSFNQKTEYAQAPLSIQMVEQVLRWDGIEVGDSAPIIAQQILSLVSSGGTERDFRNWCISSDAPVCIATWQNGAIKGSISRKWAELLFVSISLGIYSSHRYKQNKEFTEAFPFWQYFCDCRYCKKHSSLDGYVAKPDNLIWNDIYPPNGWMCGCSVLAIMEMDIAPRTRIGRPLNEKLRVECRNWFDIRPDHILKML
jgi:hypothetical protein